MYLCCEQITFLASSQTFLGVLVTLLVLCLFYDGAQSSSDDDKDPSTVYNSGGNNFLSRIIHNEIWLINNRITSRSKEIKKKLEELSSNDDLKNLTNWVSNNSFGTSHGMDSSDVLAIFGLEKRANKLQSEILSDQYDTLKRIELSNEQFRAPLYTLIYGIVIFSVDELYTIFPDIRDGLNLFVIGLTVLSILYWSGIWIKSFRRKLENRDDNNRDTETKDPDWFEKGQSNKGPSIFGISLLTGILLVIISIFLLCDALLSDLRIPVNTEILASLFLLCAILIPAILGMWRLYKCKNVGNYSYSHVLGHFTVILIYSVVIAAFMSWMWGSGLEWWGRGITLVLKETVIVFVLLNGLILPFSLPYSKVMSLYRRAKRTLSKSDKEVKDLESDIKSESSGILQKIGASVVKGK